MFLFPFSLSLTLAIKLYAAPKSREREREEGRLEMKVGEVFDFPLISANKPGYDVLSNTFIHRKGTETELNS